MNVKLRKRRLKGTAKWKKSRLCAMAINWMITWPKTSSVPRDTQNDMNYFFQGKNVAFWRGNFVLSGYSPMRVREFYRISKKLFLKYLKFIIQNIVGDIFVYFGENVNFRIYFHACRSGVLRFFTAHLLFSFE